LIIDGPYIFLEDDSVSVHYIHSNHHRISVEVMGEKIPSKDSKENNFLCYIDNSEANAGMNNFEFKLHFDNHFTKIASEYQQPEKVVAISDIEGNFYALQSILQGAGVINDKCNWTFGANHLMILGDLIDRGNNILACLWLIYKLDAQAKEYGGVVHYLLGNHELMNFSNDFRYVHPKYLYQKVTAMIYKNLFKNSSILYNWIRSKNTVEKIGDYLFVHAGISPLIVQQDYSIAEVNDMVRNNLGKEKDQILTYKERILFGDNGPLWYRGLLDYDEQLRALKEEEITALVQHFKTEKVVIGHTVVPSLKKLLNDRLLAIDIIQPAKKSTLTVKALLIKDGTEHVIDEIGNIKPIN